MNQSATKSEIKLASSHGKLHPVFGLWPVQLASNLKQWLDQWSRQKSTCLGKIVIQIPRLNSLGLKSVMNLLTHSLISIPQPTKAIATELINKIDIEES